MYDKTKFYSNVWVHFVIDVRVHFIIVIRGYIYLLIFQIVMIFSSKNIEPDSRLYAIYLSES